MKTLAKQTTTGNFAVITPTGAVIKLSKRNHYNYCTLTDAAATDYWTKISDRADMEIEITNEHVINEFFLTNEIEIANYQAAKMAKKLEKKETEITDLKKEIEILNKYKKHFGALPVYVERGFKTEEAMNNFDYKSLLKSLKIQFKLKNLKEVEEKICQIHTTSYAGRNGGFKHFSRSIDSTYTLIDNINSWSRNRNLLVTKINGDVITQRGNISISDIK